MKKSHWMIGALVLGLMMLAQDGKAAKNHKKNSKAIVRSSRVAKAKTNNLKLDVTKEIHEVGKRKSLDLYIDTTPAGKQKLSRKGPAYTEAEAMSWRTMQGQQMQIQLINEKRYRQYKNQNDREYWKVVPPGYTPITY